MSTGLTQEQVIKNLKDFGYFNTAGSDPSQPSSSATFNLNNKANEDVLGIVAPKAPEPQLSPVQKRYLEVNPLLTANDLQGMSALDMAKEIQAYEQKQAADRKVQEDRERAEQTLAARTALLYAKEDQNYQSLYDQFERQRQASLNTAKQQAYAANPFAATSTSSTGYAANINQKYDIALSDLNSKYALAKQAIAQGDMESYTEIMAQASKALNDNLATLNKEVESIQGRALSREQFGLQKANAAQNDFMDYVNTFGASPALQADLDKFMSTGQVSPGLMPFLQKGMGAGLQPYEVTSILEYETEKARQMALQEAKFLASMDSQSKSANYAAIMSSIALKGQELMAQGIMPGTMAYASGMAQATSGSMTGLNPGEATAYATIANIGAQLAGLDTTLKELEKDNDIKNMLLNYTGPSVQSIADKDLALLTAQINAIAAPIARVMFGERGVLTEPDVKRVLSTLPTAASTSEVRTALYRQILQNAKVGAINKLSVDSSTGKNTTGVAPYVQKMVDDIDSIISSIDSRGSVEVPPHIQSIFDKHGIK